MCNVCPQKNTGDNIKKPLASYRISAEIVRSGLRYELN